MKEKEVKEIEKLFDIKFIGDSRIDGRPLFKIKKDNLIVDDLREFFEISIIPLLEDHIPGFMGLSNFPAGEKDTFIIKIEEVKKDFNQYIRKEKLKKLDIYL